MSPLQVTTRTRRGTELFPICRVNLRLSGGLPHPTGNQLFTLEYCSLVALLFTFTLLSDLFSLFGQHLVNVRAVLLGED
jgi:hypothetical protein